VPWAQRLPPRHDGFRGRAPLAMAVVNEMKVAGVHVFAGALEEDGSVYSADPNQGHGDGHRRSLRRDQEFLGGFAVVDVADDEAAKRWAAKVSEGCGWPHEVRRFGRVPQIE
jgi:hypothetical protein